MSIALLTQYKQETGLSQNKIATQLNVSATVVSQYLAGIYQGDVEAIDKKVKQLVERRKAKQAEGVSSDFVKTSIAEKIINTCAMAHAMADMCIIIGDAGLGKTIALKEYAKNESDVILIEVDGTYSPKVVLQELCNELNIDMAGNRNNHLMMNAVIEKLRGSERLIIVDEAELLSYKALEIIRRIHDKTGVGVVLAGMPRLRANLQGKRGEFKQLYSRIGMQFEMPSKLPMQDIESLSSTALGTDEFSEKLNKVSHGNARRLNKLCRGVVRVAKRNDVEINESLIDTCSELLVG